MEAKEFDKVLLFYKKKKYRSIIISLVSYIIIKHCIVISLTVIVGGTYSSHHVIGLFRN